jgi:endonuclease/exonuclease/phosphatase family metal-dependent hydrolase
VISARAPLPVQRTVPLLLALATAACAAGAIPTTGPAPGVRTDTVRILTYNIAHGLGADERINLERTGRAISAALPDLVALQEVDSATQRTGSADQPARLAAFTRMDAYFGRAMPYDGGAYGVAILSDLPVASVRTHALPAAEGHEPRAVLEARIALPRTGDTLVFLSTHLDHTSGNDVRERQARRIAELFPADDTALYVLAGDLNDVPASRTLDALMLDWRDATGLDHPPTYPAANPDRKIDYVLYRPAHRIRVLEAFVLAERSTSDHRPVLVVLEVSSR